MIGLGSKEINRLIRKNNEKNKYTELFNLDKDKKYYDIVVFEYCKFKWSLVIMEDKLVISSYLSPFVIHSLTKIKYFINKLNYLSLFKVLYDNKEKYITIIGSKIEEDNMKNILLIKEIIDNILENISKLIMKEGNIL
jgi:hypothetical protein